MNEPELAYMEFDANREAAARAGQYEPHCIGHVLQLVSEVRRLQAAIRQHRDERGDDRCHADDGRLYAVLPEGDTRPAHETAVTLENCQKYIECRQTGREYVSPQRRIEELESTLAQARAICEWAEWNGRRCPNLLELIAGLLDPASAPPPAQAEGPR